MATSPSRPRFPQPDDVFRLRVSLIGIKPPIWRRILVPKAVPLPRLHAMLQATMGWRDAHLHQFRVGDLIFARSDPEDPESNAIDYRRLELRHIAPRTGSRCVYEYDLGDSWEHLIEVEEELAADTAGSPLPRCLEGERACPPEDSGGPYGYRDVLKGVRGRAARGHEDDVRASFDPERFDLERVNARLSRISLRRTKDM